MDPNIYTLPSRKKKPQPLTQLGFFGIKSLAVLGHGWPLCRVSMDGQHTVTYI